MERLSCIEQDSAAIGEDWAMVGVYLLEAMQQEAMDIGGEALRDKVTDVALAGADVLPNPEALKLLDEASPGAAERVMDRASEIRKEGNERNFRRIGGAVLKGMGKIFGGFSGR